MKNVKNGEGRARVVEKIPRRTLEQVKVKFSSRDSSMPNPPYD